jgi:hypothetical protein
LKASAAALPVQALHLNDVVHEANHARHHLRSCCFLLLSLSCKLWVVFKQLQKEWSNDQV